MTMKDNIKIENRNYGPEDILCITELTFSKMVESLLLIAHSNIQDSSFVVSTPCWSCRGKVHNASDCPCKKVAMNSNSNLNQN